MVLSSMYHHYHKSLRVLAMQSVITAFNARPGGYVDADDRW